MAPTNLGDIAVQSAKTLRAFGQRIPGAGGVLARSLHDGCPITGQRFFGGALKTMLTDREVFDRAAVIRISADAGFATIMFKDGNVSEFWVSGKEGLRKPTFRESVLVIEPIRFLFDLINEPEKSESTTSKAMA